MYAPANRSRTLAKICGVRSVDEATRIFDLGADAVGVVVATGSPRQVSPAEALQIAAAAPDLPFYYYHIPGMTGVTPNIAALLTDTIELTTRVKL